MPLYTLSLVSFRLISNHPVYTTVENMVGEVVGACMGPRWAGAAYVYGARGAKAHCLSP